MAIEFLMVEMFCEHNTNLIEANINKLHSLISDK